MKKVWGESESASILQLHHFTYSIGAFLAPLIVAPFYGTDEDDVDSICNFDQDSDDEIEGQYSNTIYRCTYIVY